MLIPLGILASAGGASAAYELISTTVLGSSQSSVTFSGLGTSAAAYKHLQIRYTGRSSQASNETFTLMRFNSDTSANYSWHYLLGNGTSVSSSSGVSDTSMALNSITTANSTANAFGAGVIDILDFQSTSKYKTIRTLGGHLSVSTIASLFSGSWRSTSAVTDITIIAGSANFVAGSRFSIYGLRGA